MRYNGFIRLFDALTLITVFCHFLCSPAMQLMFSQQGDTVFWLRLPIPVLLHPLTLMQHKIKMTVIRKKKEVKAKEGKEWLHCFLELITRRCMLKLHFGVTKITCRSRITALIWKNMVRQKAANWDMRRVEKN